MSDAKKDSQPEEEILWPNQEEVVDGIVPTDEIDQDPDLFREDTDEDDDLEMDGEDDDESERN